MAEDQTILGGQFLACSTSGVTPPPGCVADTLGENFKVEAASLPC